ncbi:MAG: lytic transglycosylase domain-containing protein [Proteobacteria bacterium]|nr:lytic transglycosylase domain-containing protein [Pseudomonadota bacterium]MBU1737503.1 lytic transglycosylase domain-containing protein [Pseudomonadota bacterium]
MLIVLATLLTALTAHATIYTFVDDNGVVHFSNIPDDPKFEPVVRLRPKLSAFTRTGQVMIPGRSGDWEPNPDSYDQLIRSAASRHHVDPRLVKALIRAESNFDYLAVSRKGALGLMQLMPLTADDMQVLDPFDPKQNIYGGTRYLRKMLGMFNGNLRMSLAAYNAGPGTVSRLGRVPKYRETLDYVQKVQYFYREYKSNSSPSKRWAKYFYDRTS